MPRWNTLFLRLLVAQAVTAFALLAIFGSLFYVERNRVVARLVAERWAPALHAVQAGNAAAAVAPVQPRYRSAELPAMSLPGRRFSPRMIELGKALGARGVQVRDMAFSQGTPSAVVWIAVQTPQGQRVWLGFVDDLVEAGFPLRLAAALALGLAAVAAVSWVVARRVAGPLERLRGRMQGRMHDDMQGGPGGADAESASNAAAEIRAIETAWREMRERLARHERERQLLLAGVSHDLRSPLARIRMAAELLPDDPAIDARRELILRNVGVADALIESFLDHVRAGELPLDQDVDVAEVARDVARTFARSSHELRLELAARARLPRGNRLLVERVLQNLLDNAFKHGRAPVCLRVRARADGAVLAIEVEDAGPGIAPGQEQPMLQAFARGDASRSTPGTGLGLAVVRRVVARLGGAIAFETAAGLHRVRVELPQSERGLPRG
jgi:two-component system osmolarity sensor histidine kinase EnvZ